MIPSVESNQDRNTALFLMCSLSPTARDSVDLELYRATADSDGSSDKYVVEHAFTQLIKDLETIGITINEDYSDVTETMESLFSFIHFVSYLLPNSLYDILKTNAGVRECIGHILTGSLGDGETLIQTYLSELGGLDGQIPVAEEVKDLADHYYSSITQSETFSDYIRHIYDLAITERLALESDADAHKLYRDIIREIIGRLSDAVNHFDDHPFYEAMTQILSRIIQDFTAPTNFTDYAYLFTHTAQDLPDDLVESFERKQYHYKVSHPWCPDYFPLRNLKPSEIQIMMMYCFIYAMSSTKDDFIHNTQFVKTIYVFAEPYLPLLKLYEE